MGNASLDIDQYRHIYTEYAPMLMRFAEKFVSGFFAEDIVHDVFLKLWDKQVFRLPENGCFMSPSEMPAWIVSAA